MGEPLQSAADLRRKQVDDKLYAEVRNASPILYAKIVAATAAIGDAYRREDKKTGADYYCERTLMGLVGEALGL